MILKTFAVRGPRRRFCAFAAVGWIASSAVASAEPSSGLHTWPQWRGPNRDGVAVGVKWPDSLDGLKQTWRVKLGPGYSGPIVAADRVFVCETEKRKTEIVRALERATGKELWKASWPGSMSVPFFAKANGDWIRSTPAYDGDSLYVAGMCDVLVCLNAADGKERWRVDFTQRNGTEKQPFGFVCSPLVMDDAVYVYAGGAFHKLNKRTGETIWKALPDDGNIMHSGAFSSPIVAELHGRQQLVVQTRTALGGVDPDKGTVLWSQEIPAFRGMNVLTPIAAGNRLFTAAYEAGAYLFDIESAGGVFAARTAWQNEAQGYMSTPVVIDGHAYLHMRNQRVTCLRLADGERTWTSKSFGKYWSMVAAGDRILALDEAGELILMRANPAKFELLSRKKISSEETWGHLAAVGDELFVRELSGVAAYRFGEGASPVPSAAGDGRSAIGSR